MAKASFTTFTDTTEQSVYAGACRVHRVDVYPYPTQTAAAFVCFWDLANPTPGTDDTYMTLPIGTITVTGTRKITFLFPGGGIRFATACTIFCAAGPESATAAATTLAPGKIDVFYSTGN